MTKPISAFYGSHLSLTILPYFIYAGTFTICVIFISAHVIATVILGQFVDLHVVFICKTNKSLKVYSLNNTHQNLLLVVISFVIAYTIKSSYSICTFKIHLHLLFYALPSKMLTIFLRPSNCCTTFGISRQ